MSAGNNCERKDNLWIEICFLGKILSSTGDINSFWRTNENKTLDDVGRHDGW
jgi:hypothetical protein